METKTIPHKCRPTSRVQFGPMTAVLCNIQEEYLEVRRLSCLNIHYLFYHMRRFNQVPTQLCLVRILMTQRWSPWFRISRKIQDASSSYQSSWRHWRVDRLELIEKHSVLCMNDCRKLSTEIFSHIQYEVHAMMLFDGSHATPCCWCPARPLRIVER